MNVVGNFVSQRRVVARSHFTVCNGVRVASERYGVCSLFKFVTRNSVVIRVVVVVRFHIFNRKFKFNVFVFAGL